MTNPSRVCFNQPCEIALLENFTPECSYCGVEFIDKPFSMSTESMTVDIYFKDVIPIKLLGTKPLYFAVIIPLLNAGPNVKILEVTSTGISTSSLSREIDHHCKIIDANVHVVELIKSAYRRRHSDNRNIVRSVAVNEQFKKAYREFEEAKNEFTKALSEGKFPEVNKVFRYPSSEGDNGMVKVVPVISRCIINDPAVIIFWSDGTKTIGKCMDNDEFNPEVGLAMAISRKFYEMLGFPNPRGAFKNQLKNAEDRSAKTKEKRERKKNNSKVINETEEA